METKQLKRLPMGIQPFNFDTERRTIGDRNVVTIK